MNKYRKKPVVIEALQFNGENWDEISDFCKDIFWKTHEFETVSTTPTIKAESKKC